MKNIYECNEYAEEIHTYMKTVESSTLSSSTYMKR